MSTDDDGGEKDARPPSRQNCSVARPSQRMTLLLSNVCSGRNFLTNTGPVATKSKDAFMASLENRTTRVVLNAASWMFGCTATVRGGDFW